MTQTILKFQTVNNVSKVASQRDVGGCGGHNFFFLPTNLLGVKFLLGVSVLADLLGVLGVTKKILLGVKRRVGGGGILR